MNFLLLLLIILIWITLVMTLYRRKIWLFYFLVSTIGLSAILVFVSRNFINTDIFLAKSIAEGIHLTTDLINIPTQVFEEAPGLLLVMVVVQREGWTALHIGVESSGLLEISVLIGLISFYPGWNLKDRIWRIFVGVALTWFANLLRMLLIVLMLHFLGKEALIVAHTFLGKLVFFGMTIAIYWYLISEPTLKMIKGNILHRSASGGNV